MNDYIPCNNNKCGNRVNINGKNCCKLSDNKLIREDIMSSHKKNQSCNFYKDRNNTIHRANIEYLIERGLIK